MLFCSHAVPGDPMPVWRKIIWSPDNNLVAIAMRYASFISVHGFIQMFFSERGNCGIQYCSMKILIKKSMKLLTTSDTAVASKTTEMDFLVKIASRDILLSLGPLPPLPE